jgi:hypothetical protein
MSLSNYDVSFDNTVFKAGSNNVLPAADASRLFELAAFPERFDANVMFQQTLFVDASALNTGLANVSDTLRSVKITGRDSTDYRAAGVTCDAIASACYDDMTRVQDFKLSDLSDVSALTRLDKIGWNCGLAVFKRKFPVNALGTPQNAASYAERIMQDSLASVTPFLGKGKPKPFTLYISDVYTQILYYIQQNVSTLSSPGDQNRVRNSYILAFYPYYVQYYITQHITTSNEDSFVTMKPTSLLVRQFALIILKLVLVQQFLIVHHYCTQDQNKFAVRNFVFATVRSIDMAFNDSDLSLYFEDITTMVSGNSTVATNLLDLKVKIDSAKNNINKAANNDAQAARTLAKTKSLLYVWITILGVAIVAFAIMLFLGRKDPRTLGFMYIFCCILVIAVFINAMVQVL